MDSFRARLEQHGLGKYADLFAEHSIGPDVLPDLDDADLEKLGVPMGDRRRIIKAAAKLAEPGPQPAPGREAERRQLRVMFGDLVDSTTLAAGLDPEDMKDVISRYQKAVGDEVARFGGYVAKPLGDGLLIYFGWPQAHEDDAERAVRSAMAAVAAVRRVTTPNGTPLGARVGIATGEVVVGDFTGVGVEEEGAVVGGTPNLAARLQSVAGENAVVVADETLKLVGRTFAFTDLGEQPLKGFDKPVRAWRVEGERASESRFDAMHGDRLTAFIGRAHEIGMLLQRWEDATDGECQLVLIAGEAGIGKSRLVAECLGRVGNQARRIAYQGSPLHTNTALYPVVRHLQSRAGFQPDDTPAEKWKKLEAALPSASSRRPMALRFLAELMSVEVPADDASGVKPSVDEQKDAAFEVLADAAKHESETAPLMIVAEDAHWLDATTQEFIERLLDRLQHSPAMVLVTYRPEFSPPWAQHANVGLLSLSRLGRRDARAIVESLMVGGQSLPADVADDIIAKGDGIPLFVAELTGSVLEAARGTDERQIQIPATLRDALSERLDRLGSAKEVAQVAAAFGREFAADMVAATLERPEGELQSDLERLMAINVVFQSSRSARRYTFHHALLQEAAYESMLKSKRREVHARIAEVLARFRPEVAETEPEVLAVHLSRAGESAKAAACWQKAGHVALRNSAYREAIGAFTNALSLMGDDQAKARADTYRAMTTAYFAVGDHTSMREHLELAARDAEAAGDQVMAAEIAMQQSHDLIHYGGSAAEANMFGERALAIATGLNDEALAYGARFSLGQAAWIGGNFAAGATYLTANLPENLRNPEAVRDFGAASSLMMDSLSILGAIQAYIGAFDSAFANLARAAALSKRGVFDLSVLQYHLHRAYLQRGDAATALPLARESVRQDTEAGLKFTVTWHQGVLGRALTMLGETDEALAVLEAAISESDAMHQPTANTRARVFLAELLVDRNVARAVETAETGLSMARTFGYRAQEAEFMRIIGTALAQNDPDAGEKQVKAGLALARELAMRPEQGHALRVLGDINRRAGRHDEDRRYAAEARALYAELEMAYWLDRLA